LVAGLQEKGVGGLCVKSRRPHRYYKTPESTVNLVLELRRSKHWGPNKIEGYLRNYKVQEISPVSHRTIHRILVEAGLNNPIPSPRKVWSPGRDFQPIGLLNPRPSPRCRCVTKAALLASASTRLSHRGVGSLERCSESLINLSSIGDVRGSQHQHSPVFHAKRYVACTHLDSM